MNMGEMTMTSRYLMGTAIGFAMTAGQVTAQDIQTYVVSTTADGGAGSLRAALTAATQGDAPARILVAVEGDIAISSGLIYEGTAALEIAGLGNLIHSGENVTLLAVPNGADLAITGLSFRGPGGFSVENRGDLDGPAGKGIAIGVPTDATGDIMLTLTDVTVADVAGHGVHMSDCSLADDCGGGSGGGGDGSAAGLDITLTNVVIDNVGHGRFDADGFRADERGQGSIRFSATGSQFLGVGADGVELDEGDAGDIHATILHSTFAQNGNYCDPAIFNAFMPAEPEAEYEDNQTAEDAIPGPVTNSPDNTCIERAVDLYDSGFVEAYEFAIDLDDGIDLDEAGEGSIYSVMFASDISNNLDEGVDWDEAGPGSIDATYVATVANFNTDDGYKMSEEDAGDVIGMVDAASAAANGGKGFVFEEADGGDLTVAVNAALTAKNDDSDDTGVEVVQEDDGAGALMVTASNIDDGIDADGVEVK